MAAIAERPTDRTGRPPVLELAPPLGRAPGSVPVEPLALPPGSVPVDPVRAAIRKYKAGLGTEAQLIAVVDRHGDALEREIARKAVQHMTEFRRAIDRAEVLAGYVEARVAQLDWLKSFPAGPGCEAVPLSCPIGGGRQVAVADLLAALRAVELDERAVQLDPQVRRRDGRRGAAPSMAALADAGISSTNVALELGVDKSTAWRFLNGHQRVPPGLRPALEQLVGVDHAALVLDGIPQHPRARAPASRAVDALRAAGGSTADLAPLIPATPSTIRKWLSGQLRPSPKHAAALAGALEQLLGKGHAARVLDLIPSSNGTTG